METIKVLIADDIEETRELILRLFSMAPQIEVVGQAADGQSAIELVKVQPVDVVLMDINMPNMNGLDTAKWLHQHYPHVIIVMMSVQNESEYLKKAMLCGAVEYIIKPFNFETLVYTIESAYNAHSKRETSLQNRARVVGFFGTKGGIGKTFLATQIAWLLSHHKIEGGHHKKQSYKVALVDLDFQFGDVGLVLALRNELNLIQYQEDLDHHKNVSINDYMCQMNDNLSVLLAPLNPADAEMIEKATLDSAINALMTEYDILILDFGVNYSDMSLAMLERCNALYLVTTPMVTALHQAKLAMEVLKSLSISQQNIHVVLNQYTPQISANKAEISTLLNCEIAAHISYDSERVGRALQSGNPSFAHSGFGRPAISKQLFALASDVIKHIEGGSHVAKK